MHNFKRVFLFCSLAALLFSCVSPGYDPGIRKGEWELIWADEFKQGGPPDSSKWSFIHGALGWNNDLQYYTAGGNIAVADGHLVITAEQRSFQGREFTSGAVSTRHSIHFQYGRVDVRARLPVSKGLHPAAWLLPASVQSGPAFHNGEIDIMEYVTFDPGRIYCAVQTGDHNIALGNGLGGSVKIPENDTRFHVYSIIWTPEVIEYYVDDVLYFSYKKEAGHYGQWPFDQPFYLILNMAVGGDWAGMHGIDGDSLPQNYLIDYVRIYQHPDEANQVDYPNQTANLISNGGFDYGIRDWNLYTREGVSGALSVRQERAVIDLPQAGDHPWEVMLAQKSVSLMAGRQYHFKFRIRSEHSGTVKAGFFRDGEPYTDYGSGTFSLMAGEWKECTLSISTDQDALDAQLLIQSGLLSGRIEVDDVVLQPGI